MLQKNYKLWLIALFCVLSATTTFSQSTILWSVQHPQQKTKSHIVGTFHQIGNSFVDSLPLIKQSLYESDLAVFESIGDVEELRNLMNRRSDDNSYTKYLKKKEIAYLEDISAEWSVPVTKLSPRELVTKLAQTYFLTQCGSVKPTDKWEHFDNYLIHLAKSGNIPLKGLESDSIQLEYINQTDRANADWKHMKKPIQQWIHQIRKSKNTKRNCQDTQDYMNFNLDYQLDTECGENPIISERNRNWIALLSEVLPENNTFIAVGIFHLYGKCGLIHQLRTRGYRVEPVML